MTSIICKLSQSAKRVARCHERVTTHALHTAGYTGEHMRTLAGADGLILLRHSEILDTHGHTRRTRADARGQVETDS